MDDGFFYETIVDRTRRRGESLDDAAAEVARGLGGGAAIHEAVTRVVEQIRAEAERHLILDGPSGVSAVGARNSRESEAKIHRWYLGPQHGDLLWPQLEKKLMASGLAPFVPDIDVASTKIVAQLAEPNIHGLCKKGLVVGYVQSGKTANYTAVTAKAADAGYRIFIVLAGMHNNLRRQTQVRLEQDLGVDDWIRLTTRDADFGGSHGGTAMVTSGARIVAVVKKNTHRLQRLRDWLRDVPLESRRRCPILIIDDEADQATPNTRAAQDELSRINELVREIWAEIPTGSYVGYTATPFANVFMAPDDEKELYPSDFIIDLPKPNNYFGAERLFGRRVLESEDDAENEGLPMIRVVEDHEAADLKPPSQAVLRAAHEPDVPDSLRAAVTWFVAATATRWARGQAREHSSMLVHTTHYVAPHFAMQDKLRDLLETLAQGVQSGVLDEFKLQWDDEIEKAATVATERMPDWSEVAEHLPGVLAAVRVVVDNGSSADRLDYERDEDGGHRPQTVIAVGGGTLSRGLTLEGLVVSYFTRTSSTYDTLLQMGRWFGYRAGYEDLPRIWMTGGLRSDFEFLAIVEEDLRERMRQLQTMQLSPAEYGVRVRAHPGRLSITSRAKMFHADVVRVSYSGEHRQAIVLPEGQPGVLKDNLRLAVRALEQAQERTGVAREPARQRWVHDDVGADLVLEFLEQYKFHSDQSGLDSEHVVGWIRRTAEECRWNLAVVGAGTKRRRPDGGELVLPLVDLGPIGKVNPINRAPLVDSPIGVANIKGLMSTSDLLVDADRDLVAQVKPKGQPAHKSFRALHMDKTGVLILYPVSRKSIPLEPAASIGSRRQMEADVDLLGIGIVFPELGLDDVGRDGTYYSVRPDWEAELDEDDDGVPRDLEGDAEVVTPDDWQPA